MLDTTDWLYDPETDRFIRKRPMRRNPSPMYVALVWLMAPVFWVLFPFLVLALYIWVKLDKPRKP